MMEDPRIPGVRLERNGSVAVIEFAENTMNRRFVGWLEFVLNWADSVSSLRALVFTGMRRVFMTGADLIELQQLRSLGDIDEFLRIPHQLMRRIANDPRLTVAAINGHCLGGGLELACICDYRIAAADFRETDGTGRSEYRGTLGFPEVRLGIVPALGGAFSASRLARNGAFGLLATGRLITAEEGLCMGLVDEVVDRAELPSRALAFCDIVLANPRSATVSLKRLLCGEWAGRAFSNALDQAKVEFAQCCASPEKDERIAAARGAMAGSFRRGLADRPTACPAVEQSTGSEWLPRA
jgi:enoyl-CoA hydratase/carnithine racemase